MDKRKAKKIGTLMLIDDNKVDQMIYARIVKRSGLVDNLLSFYFADDALDHLKRSDAPQPNLILLDISMPRMDGFEFLEAAKMFFADNYVPVVVMLTTSLNPNDEIRASEYKAVRDFLNKPLTIEHLEEMAAYV